MPDMFRILLGIMTSSTFQLTFSTSDRFGLLCGQHFLVFPASNFLQFPALDYPSNSLNTIELMM